MNAVAKDCGSTKQNRRDLGCRSTKLLHTGLVPV